MNTQTKYVALISVDLEERHASDGILERIDDLAYDHNAEHSGTRLAYTMEASNRDELRGRVIAFSEALREFFRALEIRISAFKITVTYREEPAPSAQESA